MRGGAAHVPGPRPPPRPQHRPRPPWGGAAIVPDRSPPLLPHLRPVRPEDAPEKARTKTGGNRSRPPGEAESPDPGSAGYVRPTHTLRPIPDHAPARTEPGCKNPDTKKGPAFTGRTLGISAAEAAGNFTCGKPSYSRRWPRRPALPRCGATGCIWPYGPNATSNRS